MKLEQMDAFFTARLDGYDEHMMTEIEGALEVKQNRLFHNRIRLRGVG